MYNIPRVGKAEMSEAFAIAGDQLGGTHPGNSRS